MSKKIIGWLLIGVIVGGLISALFYIKGVEDAAYVIGFIVFDLLISVILTYAVILILDANKKGRD